MSETDENATRQATDAGIVHDPHWYRDAIIYQLHIKAFFDSDGDGLGDFEGLVQKLDYVESLGVNTIWLLPFYPSPMRDDGYDIADYRRINPAYGNRRDFRRLIREAHRRGIRVITELVINHTSDQHPWFQAARRAPRGSAKRDFYVWSDSDEKYAGTRIIFTDTETSNWTWDPVAQQYYWHRFFSHQPDLNFDNPSVVKAIIRVMRYWLDMGVDGLRLDAIPYLCEREGTSNENLPETHAVVKQMRKVVDEHYEGRMFLAEANMWPEDVIDYFGDGDECHMAYHFPVMPRMYMALAHENRHPVVEILEQTPAIPDGCQWAMFLRNHDELTLEMVTDEERDYMYQTYAEDPRARINVGIRRRLAPLLGNDEARIKLLTSLLLSMPGSPILYYGDEIGMGDNIYLGDRNGVRTPMQWSPDRNAGFSRADPQQLYLPPIMDPVYGYQSVNVEAQSREASSLLNWMRRIIAVRKSSRAFGRGELTLLAPGNRHVLAYLREHDDEIVLCVANLAATAQPVELDLTRFQGLVPVEMMGRSAFPPIGELPYFLTLPGHGFFWFRLTGEAVAPDWHAQGPPGAGLATLVLSEHWDSFFPERLSQERQRVSHHMLRRFTSAVLPRFLGASRWFPWPAEAVETVEIERRLLWRTDEETYLLLRLAAARADGQVRRCQVPLALAWGGDQDDPIRDALPGAVARVRERARTGVLYEAVRSRQFCGAVLGAIRGGAVIELDGGRLVGTPTTAAPDILERVEGDASTELTAGYRPNTTVLIGERVVLKLMREPQTDGCAELEISRYLTERTAFSNFPRLAGDLTLDDGEAQTVLLLAVEYRRNQGDAWRYVRHHLDRFLDEARLRPLAETRGALDQTHADSLALMATLGRRLGELHLALAGADGALAPVPIAPDEPAQWKARLRREADETLAALARRSDELPASARGLAGALAAGAGRLRDRIDALAVEGYRGLRCRYHGDLHLGRLLLAEGDVIITGFSAEPALARIGADARQSPLRDLAELLRSIDWAVQASLRAFRQASLGDVETLRGLAADWQRRARRALLDAWFDAVADSPLDAAGRPETEALIELFVLEKLLREIRHGRRGDDPSLAVNGLLEHLAVAAAT